MQEMKATEARLEEKLEKILKALKQKWSCGLINGSRTFSIHL